MIFNRGCCASGQDPRFGGISKVNGGCLPQDANLVWPCLVFWEILSPHGWVFLGIVKHKVNIIVSLNIYWAVVGMLLGASYYVWGHITIVNKDALQIH
jgi:hypothetical protein